MIRTRHVSLLAALMIASSVRVWAATGDGDGASEGMLPVHVSVPEAIYVQETLGRSGSGGAGNPCISSALSLQYNAAGSFGCVSGVTADGTSLTFASDITMNNTQGIKPASGTFYLGNSNVTVGTTGIITSHTAASLADTWVFLGSETLHADGASIYCWNNASGSTITPAAPGTCDTGLSRTSAGLVEFNSGTAGTLRDAKARTWFATGANDTSMQTLTGGSITGSGSTGFSALTGTWNTSGNPIGVSLAFTETAKGATSRYFSIKGGASATTDEFYVQTGGVTVATGASAAANFYTTSVTGGSKGADTVNAIAYYVQGIGTRYYVTTDFTTANNTNLQTITGLVVPLPANVAITVPFRCDILYSQATGAAAVSFGVQTDGVTPTFFDSWGVIGTDVSAATAGNTAIANTTATAVVTGTPAAQSTIYSANINGYLENPSNASTTNINIMVKTATGADAVTIKHGSFCTAL